MIMKSENTSKKNIAILVQQGVGGGAQRMAANQTLVFEKDCNVWFVLFENSDDIYAHGGKLVDMNMPPLKTAPIYKRVMNTINRTKYLAKFKKEKKLDAVISHLDGANLVNVLSGRGSNKCRIICVYHSMPSANENPTFIHRAFHQFIGRFSDRYVMVSKLAAMDMIKNFGVRRKDVSAIHNFSDNEKISRLKDMELPEDAQEFINAHSKLIITVGRLTLVKRQERLIKLLKQLRSEKGLEDTGLMILGDGPQKEFLQEITADNGLEDHVYMPGNVDNPFMYISRSDVFVLCSDYEGLPMALTEAVACGCPVVSCDMKSGAREILAPDTDVTKVTEGIEYAKYGILTRPFENKANADETFGEAKEADKAEILKEDATASSALYEGVMQMLKDEKLVSAYKKSCPECAEMFSVENIVKRWKKLM